jgi:hypothetical protein
VNLYYCTVSVSSSKEYHFPILHREKLKIVMCGLLLVVFCQIVFSTLYLVLSYCSQRRWDASDISWGIPGNVSLREEAADESTAAIPYNGAVTVHTRAP